MRLIALSLVLALVACGSKSKPPAEPAPTDPVVAEPTPPTDPAPPTEPTPKATPSDAELDKLFEASLDFFDELAVVLEANAKDCKKMAPALDAVFSKHQALLEEAKSYKGNPEVDKKADAYMEVHKDRLSAATNKMMGGMQACSNDPDVQNVMKRFDDM